MTKENGKPPIGVIPCALVAENRIYGLAEAIVRSEIPYNVDLIKTWAKEIILQCDLVKEMEKYNENSLSSR